jgi:hypothetical protein
VSVAEVFKDATVLLSVDLIVPRLLCFQKYFFGEF